LEAHDDLLRGEAVHRIGDRLHRIGVAKRAVRTEPVLPEAADGLLETRFRERTVLGIVRGPPTGLRTEDGRDDEHVGGAFRMRSHDRAEGRIATRLACDEQDPLTLPGQLVGHHSSNPRGHGDDRTHRPTAHRQQHGACRVLSRMPRAAKRPAQRPGGWFPPKRRLRTVARGDLSSYAKGDVYTLIVSALEA